MIVLSLSTAGRIAKCLKSMNADNREFCGETEEGVDELIECLESPLPENYGDCNYCIRENEISDKCEECTASHVSAFAMHWEAK